MFILTACALISLESELVSKRLGGGGGGDAQKAILFLLKVLLNGSLGCATLSLLLFPLESDSI